METLIYQHRRNDTNEVFYVGIGNSTRPTDTKNRNNHWHNIVNKHGYTTEILITDLSWEDACDIEIGLIEYYGRCDMGTGTLVNMTSGGDGTHELSEESLKKIGDASRGKPRTDETKRKISKAHKGKKLSEETKRNISIARKGVKHKPMSDEARKHLSELRKGKPKSESHKRKISESLKGEKNNMFGKNHSKESRLKMSMNGGKQVIQLDKDGVVIREWKSVITASNELGISKSGIANTCHGRQKSSGGFKWKY